MFLPYYVTVFKTNTFLTKLFLFPKCWYPDPVSR